MRARAYYNEIEPYCVEWLRNLIKEGLIPDGDVDSRDIREVRASDLRDYTSAHFFAGLGGWGRALRLARWPDERPVWTGSCPCQPFSLAGKRQGFADERHLWPVWAGLIKECRPATVLGEQVASATEWLGVVRSDLEALDYAVGAMPIQAASAGADHLRDRFWFVGQADAHDAGSQGWSTEPECADQRSSRSDGLADAECVREPQSERLEPSVGGRAFDDCEVHVADACGGRRPRSSEGQGEQPGRTEVVRSSDPRRDMGDGSRISEREPHNEGDTFATGGEARSISGGPSDPLEWVLGADGKARRIKPGVRLLAHGIPGRVAKLRAFGNAIDPRPAAAFIEAAVVI